MFVKKIVLLSIFLSSAVRCPITKTYLTTVEQSGKIDSKKISAIAQAPSILTAEPLVTKNLKLWFGDGLLKNKNKKIRAVRLPMLKSQFSVAAQQKKLQQYTDSLQEMLNLADNQVSVIRKVEKGWLIQKFHIKSQNNSSGPTVFMLAHQGQVYFYFKKAKVWKAENSAAGNSIFRQLKNYVTQNEDTFSSAFDLFRVAKEKKP